MSEPESTDPAAKLGVSEVMGYQDPVIQRELLAAIVESSDDAIVSKSIEGGRILSWNRGAERLFGYGPQEVLGKPILILIPPELHAEEDCIMAKLKRGEHIDHFETTRLTKEGRRIPLSVTISPIRNSHGAVIGASKVARDISERRRIEQAVRERQQALHEADRRKDEFLALLAHELRNSLAPIRYSLAASKKAASQDLWRRAQEVIERQVRQMSRLLDDLLDISRITRGALELKKSAVDLASLLESALEIARPALNARGHHLSIDLPTQRIVLEVDTHRMIQVFANLLINAAKYTDPNGQIHLSAALQDHEVVVCVRDNGIGLPPELMPHLFDLYSRGRNAARREGGLGIGLSLVHGVTSLHGGTVEAHSEGPGKGSEFRVRLPVADAQSLPIKVDPDQTMAAAAMGLRILVVDDSRDAADMCATLLELLGHHIQTAYTARQALTLGETFRPDAILLDISLPDMDGYELAQQVRASAWGHNTALIAVTGWAQPGDRQRAFAAGFSHYLIKPIAPQALESILQSLQSPRAPAG